MAYYRSIYPGMSGDQNMACGILHDSLKLGHNPFAAVSKTLPAGWSEVGNILTSLLKFIRVFPANFIKGIGGGEKLHRP